MVFNAAMPADQTQAACLLKLLPELERTVCVEQQPADQVFVQLCRAHREWGARDRRLFGDVLFGWFRWRGWLAELLPAQPAAALALVGWLDGIEHPALRILAAQANLELKPIALEHLADKFRALEDILKVPKTIEQLVPDWVPAALVAPLGISLTQHLAAMQRRPPVWLRVAPGSVPAVLNFFGPRGAAHDRVAGAIAVTPPANLPGLRAATGVAAIVQDLASQCVGPLCAPRPGECWWDVCAGAGGKTLHLAALMNNTGSILATDVRTAALHELERRAAEAGTTIIRTQRVDTAPTDTKFDGILVDAPCSGLGTWNRNPDMRWRTPGTDIAARAATQRELLARVAPHVRPGGTLVYAVCTITSAETLDVLTDFLRTHPEFQPEACTHPLTGATCADGIVWVWPWDGPCDGMFIARLRRIG
ncbi:MAG: RsmB/NOP family class I SAM-dependent RNA methyltransferase [Verrucomicrobia bacterium]|nr:MAG: RsmB/NOP family class I SAM-dependent RNA methyltransferase [Verrucomicrobiota bacterium]